MDRYLRFRLVPCKEDPATGYRHVDGAEALQRVELIRILTKKPFRLDLEDIGQIFNKVPLAELQTRKNNSVKALHKFLLERDLL